MTDNYDADSSRFDSMVMPVAHPFKCKVCSLRIKVPILHRVEVVFSAIAAKKKRTARYFFNIIQFLFFFFKLLCFFLLFFFLCMHLSSSLLVEIMPLRSGIPSIQAPNQLVTLTNTHALFLTTSHPSLPISKLLE